MANNKGNKRVYKFDTFSLTECKDGFYLYDYIEGMNIAMYAKTEQEAHIKAIEYYQRTLKRIRAEHKALSDKVDHFLEQFKNDDDEGFAKS